MGDGPELSDKALFGECLWPLACTIWQAENRLIVGAAGIDTVFLLNDLFYHGGADDDCDDNIDRGKAILEALGVELNPEKTVRASKIMAFLGIVIDTIACTLSIPRRK